MVSLPTARDLLAKFSVTLAPDMDVLQAIDDLIGKQASGAPVVDENGGLVGILTEKECLRVLSNEAWGEVSGGKVRDFMSEPRIVVTSEMDIFAAAKAFLETNFPVLPVLENGRLLGAMTQQDLLHSVQEANRTLDREREMRLQSTKPDSPAFRKLEASSTPEDLMALLNGPEAGD